MLEHFALTKAEILRAVLAGALLPCLVVALSWTVASAWNDLPADYPAHWGADGVDRFDSPRTYIDNQMTVAAVAAGASVVTVFVGLLGGGWSPLNRGLTAVALGVTGSITFGFFVQLLRSRGLSTEQVIELGGGAGIAGVFVGFLTLFLASFFVLPRGRYRETPTSRAH